MAKKYVLDGYTTPPGVTDTESVKKMQQMLGVKADGVWGPQSQRAYNARMDGISDSYYPNNEKNARMRGVSAPHHSQSTQYQNIRGISEPYFSGGDSYVGYTEYLDERAQRNKSAADDDSVIEAKVRNLSGGNGTRQKQEEWIKQVSSFLPGATTLGTGQNPGGGSMPYAQDPHDILYQRNAAQQAANGFGVFRLAAQKSDEEMKRRNAVKKAIETGKDAAETYGFSAGLMPVPQYGASGNPAPSSFPANPATPQEILAEVDRKRQISNGMGAFRQAAQKSDAESARRAGVKRAMQSGQQAAQANGYSAGLMPLPQYGQNPAAGSTPYDAASNTNKYIRDMDVDEYIDHIETMQAVADYAEAYGGVVGGAAGEALEIGGAATSGFIDALRLALVVDQDLHDEDKKLGLSTLTTAAGIFGGFIGGAVGGFALGPVGAYAGSYIGSELLSKLAEEIYYSEPVSYEEALERVDKFSSPFLPKYDPLEILAQRQALLGQ